MCRFRFSHALLALLAAAAVASGTPVAAANDYPTVAVADYVFSCMASNGQTREALQRCACSIDVIASVLSYENYVQAETVLSLRQISGDKSTLFRTAPAMREAVANLKRAQAEAEVRCF